jgi:hypothetical protein
VFGVGSLVKGLDWADYWECMISALLSTAFAGLTKPLLLAIQAFNPSRDATPYPLNMIAPSVNCADAFTKPSEQRAHGYSPPSSSWLAASRFSFGVP